jgi:hypothetical protein
VVIYEKSTTDRICHTHQVIEAAAPRMSFNAGIVDAAQQTFVALHHKEDNQMEHS